MSDSIESGSELVKSGRDVTLEQVDALAKSHKEWDGVWENFVNKTRVEDKRFFRFCGQGLVIKLFQNGVSCEVLKRVVVHFESVGWNETFQAILRIRIKNRCIKYKGISYYSDCKLFDEYIEIIMSQREFDLFYSEVVDFGTSKERLYFYLFDLFSVGELNYCIKFLLQEHPAVFEQLANLVQHEKIARHFFSFTIKGDNYKTDHLLITPCEMLVYFDHSTAQASSLIDTFIRRGILTPQSRSVFGFPMIFSCVFSKFDSTHRPRGQRVDDFESQVKTTHITKQVFTSYIRNNLLNLCNLKILMAQLNFFMQHSVDFFFVKGTLPRENYAEYMNRYYELEDRTRDEYHKANLFQFIKGCRKEIQEEYDEIQKEHQMVDLDYHSQAVRRFFMTTVYLIRLAKSLKFCKKEIKYSRFKHSEDDLIQLLAIKERLAFKKPTTEEEALLVLQSVGMRFFFLHSMGSTVTEPDAKRSKT